MPQLRQFLSNRPKYIEPQPDSSIEFNRSYVTTGVGDSSYQFHYTILNHRDVQEITAWKYGIITASRGASTAGLAVPGQICVWTTRRKLLHSEPASHGVNAMIVWDGILVTGSIAKLQFWKLPKSGKIRCIFSSKIAILSTIVWNDMLYTQVVTPDTRGQSSFYAVWNKEGKRIKIIANTLDIFSARHQELVVDHKLWTSKGFVIKIWKQTEDYGMECVQTLKGHSKNIVNMCLWKSRVISVAQDQTIRLWSVEGEPLSVFNLDSYSHPSAMSVWLGNLVVSTDTFAKICLLWKEDGTKFQSIQPLKEHFEKSSFSYPIHSLFSHDGLLWQGTQGLVYVWSFGVDWNVKRLLWLAFVKNKPAECHLARLPKELIHYIITMLY